MQPQIPTPSVEGRSDDLTMLKLVETHCIPILTNGIDLLLSVCGRFVCNPQS